MKFNTVSNKMNKQKTLGKNIFHETEGHFYTVVIFPSYLIREKSEANFNFTVQAAALNAVEYL